MDPQDAVEMVNHEKEAEDIDGDSLMGANKPSPLSNDKEGHSSSDLGFVHAFIAALSVIIVSEIGDKTFFIAAIMAMRYSRFVVFGGALSALGFMTFLSVLLGSLAVIIPRLVSS